jgi:membrane protein DedA with SNARE-associated domain
MGLTELIIEYSTKIIEATGYLGVMILMVFESMIAPVPSEAVMPFAGFLIHEGKFTWFGVAVSSTTGSIIGSVISYYLGLYGGKPIIQKFGKYLLLDNHHLELTEKFFDKYGERAVFLSRFIPVVRHLISIPAGIGRMNFTKFLVYTTVGACAWNMILTYIGYVLKENWNTVKQYTKGADYLIVLVILLAFGYFVYKSLNKRKNSTES